MADIPPLAVSISEAATMVGLGKTSLYAAIADGRLKTRKAGRRTLVEMTALREFIDELPSSQSVA